MDNTSSRKVLPIALVLVVLASLLGIYTAGDNVTTMDVKVLEWIQRWQGDIPAALQRTGDMLGSTRLAMGVLAVGIAAAALLRGWRIVIFLVFVALLRIVGMGLKPLFESPRPVMPEVRQGVYEMAEGFGYPSGHSMTAAMVATMAVVIVWNATTDVLIRWLALLLAVIYAVLVGWSRVWVGAHWPTDVLGGWSYGVALVLIAWEITTPFAGSRNAEARQQ